MPQNLRARRHGAIALLVCVLVLTGCTRVATRGTTGTSTETARPAKPTETDLAFERGIAALEAGRYSDAIPELFEVLDERPNDMVARYNLGVALLRVRSWKEAVNVLSASYDPDVKRRKLPHRVRVPLDTDADYMHALGTAYQELRKFDKALACFEAAMEADPDHLKARYARALALEAGGDLLAARGAWIDYLDIDPDSAWGEGARKHLAILEKRLAEPEPPDS
ncbi:MAG: tetratricopeptide repeat protein [Candidatus Krumholzibacteriia bacterium]